MRVARGRGSDRARKSPRLGLYRGRQQNSETDQGRNFRIRTRRVGLRLLDQVLSSPQFTLLGLTAEGLDISGG